ncbi:cell wall-binding repeat-containing protein [Herbiconiux sp. UC225_62]|uniref:cell wall-binding repeat-containing protein n=1 Tax=Herbiconiux sp. UC225_62 TaxID=3350168 RepID=UPI0036D3FFC2
MKTTSQGRSARPARWLLALTLGAILTAAPSLASVPSARAAVPPVAVDDAFTTAQSAPLIEEIRANDSLGGEDLSWTVITYPKHGQLTGGRADNKLIYTPDRGFAGADSMQYCLATLHGFACLSNTATVTITVLAGIPVDDHFAVAAMTPLQLKRADVLANDVNADHLTWSALVEAPKHGTLTKSSLPEAVIYTPAAGFAGTDSFKYCLTSIANTPCESPSATVSIDVGLSQTTRIFGADRFEVAVKIADAQYPTTAPVVFVASGLNYPDALSAGPAAVKLGGPLLLTLPDRVPDVVLAKIVALNPAKIIVVGGVNSISTAVSDRLTTLIPGVSVERIGGADRYEVSRAIADRAFGDVAHAYVATGSNFPDALSAGAAAGTAHEPVVLVNGGGSAADAPTLALFAAHKASSLTIVGGVNSVSPAVEASLAARGTVVRSAGADRFEASSNLNRSAFSKADTVYLATGLNYPDALAGGVLAGATGSPLYVIPQDCVPVPVLDDITRLGAKNVVLLGGPNSLTDDVARLVGCAP